MTDDERALLMFLAKNARAETVEDADVGYDMICALDPSFARETERPSIAYARWARQREASRTWLDRLSGVR